MRATDVEINRALNALATTISDQRLPRLDVARMQQILDGALAGERKLVIRRTGEGSGEILASSDALLIATVERQLGGWVVQRVASARGSSWAVPRAPAPGSDGAD